MNKTWAVATSATAVCSAMLLTLSACSGNSNDSGGRDTTTMPSSSSSSSTSSSASMPPSSSSDTGSGSTVPSDLRTRLVTAQDVGTGFTGGPTDPKGTQALPCTPSAPPLSTQLPARQTVFATFSNKGDTAEAGETIYQYSSVAEAQRALAIATKGFSCSQGVVSGKPVRIVTRAPRTTAGSVTAQAWDFAASKDALGTAVVLQAGDRLAALELVSTGVARYAIDIPTLVDHSASRLR